MEAFRFQLEHGKLGLVVGVVVALDVVGVGKEECAVSTDVVGAASRKSEYVAVVLVVAAVVLAAAVVVVVVH